MGDVRRWLQGGLDRSLHERVQQVVEAAFLADGWEVVKQPLEVAPIDFVARKNSYAYAVELKALGGRARRSALHASFAQAILQSRVLARELSAEPLVLLAAPSLSAELVNELEYFVQRFGGGVSWGLLDERDLFSLHGPGLSTIRPAAITALEARKSFALSGSPSDIHNPFTDLGQWMLKVLLAPKIEARWLRAPRSTIGGVADLAKSADVSAASASRLLAVLGQEGYVTQDTNVIRLVRVVHLLEGWRAASQRPVEERFARLLLPSKDPLARLRSVLAAREEGSRSESSGQFAPAGPRGQRVCLALFAACNELQVGFVRGAPIHIYSEDLSDETLARLQLHPVEHRAEAELIVRRPRVPEAVFRACVEVQGVPVADIVQCWLDVSSHPARGTEQAAEILERLRPSDWDK